MRFVFYTLLDLTAANSTCQIAGGILLGVRPVLARMPDIPCVGSRMLSAYDDDVFIIIIR